MLVRWWMLRLCGWRVGGCDGCCDVFVYGVCFGGFRRCGGCVGAGLVTREGEVMLGGGYKKKKKILKLAQEYASGREFGWDVYYREMSGLLK